MTELCEHLSYSLRFRSLRSGQVHMNCLERYVLLLREGVLLPWLTAFFLDFDSASYYTVCSYHLLGLNILFALEIGLYLNSFHCDAVFVLRGSDSMLTKVIHDRFY